MTNSGVIPRWPKQVAPVSPVIQWTTSTCSAFGVVVNAAAREGVCTHSVVFVIYLLEAHIGD